MFKVLILAAQNNITDARMEYLIRDRLNWSRFLGFDLGAPTPDANTIRLYREKRIEASALDALSRILTGNSRSAAISPWVGRLSTQRW
jgi:IS5 family transposase